MPSIRVIAGAAIGSLFVCGLFGGQGMAQTASTEPVGKPIQLLQPRIRASRKQNRPRSRRPSTRAKLILRRKSVPQLSPRPKKAPLMGHRR